MLTYMKNLDKDIIIFSDIDGSFMNHNDYSFEELKPFVDKISQISQIIFVSSKTYAEIIKLKKKLKISFPFIVENGACIFFPKNYFKKIKSKINFFEIGDHIGCKISKFVSSDYKIRLNFLKKEFNFKFFSEMSISNSKKITNLDSSNLIDSKKRMFTDPIFWQDKENKIFDFQSRLKDLHLKTSYGGRFIHVSDNFNKGKSIRKLLNLINVNQNKTRLTISLGDSNNDVSMLEITDYSCIVKNIKKKNLILKKLTNKYYSKSIAPEGWKESLIQIFKKEKIYF